MYKFVKKGLDDYELQIGKETYNFRRTNETAKIMQDINKRTEVHMLKYLAQNGLTKNDFIITTNDGKGHTTKNESNYLELKQEFYNEEISNIFGELIKKDFNFTIDDLGKKLEFEDLNNLSAKEQDLLTKFTEDYMKIILNQDKEQMSTPSK